MNSKTRTTLILVTILFFLISASSVLAITGSIGNSRMVLRPEVGEELEKYILVKNKNDVSLTIELSADGDLAENVEITEDTFVLQPGEEKKAYFTIYADEPGTTETKINVKFTPEEGNGVGLTSTVILITSGEGGGSVFDFNSDNNDNLSVGFGNSPDEDDDSQSRLNLSPTSILLVSTIALVVIFILLIVFYSKMKKRKGAGRLRG